MAEKIQPADAEASRFLTLQTTPEKNAGRADKVLLTLFFAFLLIPAILHLLLPDREFSERENRSLASFPELTVTSVASGRFMSELPAYLADQFPFRDALVGLKAYAEAAMLRGGNNGVLFGLDGTLVTRDDYPDLENLRENLAAAAAFRAYCEKRGIPFTAAIAGRTADVLDGTVPLYGSEYSDRLWSALDAAASDAGLPYMDLRTPLRSRALSGEYVYYRTDHHWTTYGAHLAAADILASMGKTLPPMHEYDWTTVKDFYGTTWSAACAPWIKPDELLLFRYDGDTDFTTTIVDTGASFRGFYDESYLAVKDKYAVFLSGNNALTVIRRDGAVPRETLLIVKDSFAHAAAPFFAQFYDLVLLDLRYYKQIPAKLLDEYGVSRVLILQNIESLTSSASLRLLAAGLGD